jgi:hypothetical protein
MLEIGAGRTAVYVEGLRQQLREGVEELGGTVVTPAAAHGPMLAIGSTTTPLTSQPSRTASGSREQP